MLRHTFISCECSAASALPNSLVSTLTFAVCFVENGNVLNRADISGLSIPTPPVTLFVPKNAFVWKCDNELIYENPIVFHHMDA